MTAYKHNTHVPCTHRCTEEPDEDPVLVATATALLSVAMVTTVRHTAVVQSD